MRMYQRDEPDKFGPEEGWEKLVRSSEKEGKQRVQEK